MMDGGNHIFHIEGSEKHTHNEVAKALLTIYEFLDKDDLIWIAGKILEDPKVIGKVRRVVSNPFVKALFNKS